MEYGRHGGAAFKRGTHCSLCKTTPLDVVTRHESSEVSEGRKEKERKDGKQIALELELQMERK